MSVDADIRDSFLKAQAAQQAYCEALMAFEVACVRGDDKQIELLRAKLVTCVEDFTFHHAEAHRHMRK